MEEMTFFNLVYFTLEGSNFLMWALSLLMLTILFFSVSFVRIIYRYHNNIKPKLLEITWKEGADSNGL